MSEDQATAELGETCAKKRWHKLTAFLATQAVLTAVHVVGLVLQPESAAMIVATYGAASSANLVTYTAGNVGEHKALHGVLGVFKK